MPWEDGEELAYEIHWGLFVAAEGVFTARRHPQQPGQWVFLLDLKSRGVVETLSPIRSEFKSVTQVAPWRSRAFEEKRKEGKRRYDRVIRPDYRRKKIHVHDRRAQDKTDYSFDHTTVEDIGSLLYRVRVLNWGSGMKREFHVYQDKDIRTVEASFVKREKWDGRETVVVFVRPNYGDPAKDAKGYGVNIWMTDDREKLPIRAALKAKFGTFDIRLKEDDGFKSK